jgi:hypothetical protein
VISRYLVIALALGAMAKQLLQHAWIEGAGLAGLAAGLIILQLAAGRPRLKPFAWAAFSVTAVAMVLVWIRLRGTM